MRFKFQLKPKLGQCVYLLTGKKIKNYDPFRKTSDNFSILT